MRGWITALPKNKRGCGSPAAGKVEFPDWWKILLTEHVWHQNELKAVKRGRTKTKGHLWRQRGRREAGSKLLTQALLLFISSWFAKKGIFSYLFPQIMTPLHWFFFPSLFSLLKMWSFVRGRAELLMEMWGRLRCFISPKQWGGFHFTPHREDERDEQVQVKYNQGLWWKERKKNQLNLIQRFF